MRIDLLSNRQTFGFLRLVVFKVPFQYGLVAQPIFPCLHRDAGQSGDGVNFCIFLVKHRSTIVDLGAVFILEMDDIEVPLALHSL